MSESTTKDPRRVAAGKAGMRARWGPEPRLVRLDDLSAPQRRLVLALVDAARKETEPLVSETSNGSAKGDDDGDRRLPPAS